MSGIYIKDMEMPTSCGYCPIGSALYCSLMPGVPALVKEYNQALRTNRRHSNCPLVSVSPHGRLIDADALIETLNNNKIPYNNDVNYFLMNAPTIIPADKEQTE